MNVFDPSKESLYTLKEDVLPTVETPYTGSLPDDGPRVGVSSTIGLHKTKIARVPVRYTGRVSEARDRISEMDVYRMGGQLAINFYCWKCGNSSWIREGQKEINFDLTSNVLSISPFKCSWEYGRGTDATKGDRIAFGMGLCNLAVVVDNNIAKDSD